MLEDLVPQTDNKEFLLKRQGHRVPEERRRDRIEDLKAENRKLRKEVAQLRKEHSKMRNRDIGLQDLFDEFGEVEHQMEKSKEEHRFECPHCSSHNTRLMSLRYDNSHFTCVDCGKTGPVKND